MVRTKKKKLYYGKSIIAAVSATAVCVCVYAIVAVSSSVMGESVFDVSCIHKSPSQLVSGGLGE